MDLKMEVYTPALELIGFLEIQRSVIWEDKAFSTGSFSIESLITDESLKMLRPENIIWIEGETAGIIEYVQEETGENGPYITVKGRTLTGILDRRILWGLYNLSGTVPAIMNALVDDCCVNPTRGDVESRKIPGLVLLDAPAGGDTIQVQATGGTLLERLETLGETYGVAFGVRFNPAVPQMEFWTRWGQDRSIHQSANNPVLYSTELDDVLSSEYTYNSQDYRNVALVAGEGDGADRVCVTVENEVEDSTDGPAVTPPPEPGVTKYTITLLVDPEGGGTVNGGKTVAAGVSVTVTASPAEDYTFVEWRENGVRVSGDKSYTFTVNSDRTLTAVFAVAVKTYTITATVDPSGSGNITGAERYKEGAAVNLVATANDGYSFAEWRETLTKRLPDGYTELEYIRSSGAQHINTGFYPTTESRIVFDAMPVSFSSGFACYFGARNENSATASQQFCLMEPSGTGFRYDCFGTNKTFTLSEIKRYVFDANRNRLTVGDITVEVSATEEARVCEYPLTLFALNNIGVMGQSPSSIMLYSCKIYDNDVLMRDFVPCKNPSGSVGLYDLVTATFYGNAGTGTFIDGPEIGGSVTVHSEPDYSFTAERDRDLVAAFEEKPSSRLPAGYMEIEYIQSSGTQYIDTGLVPSTTTKIDMDVEPIAAGTSTARYFCASYRVVTVSGGNAYCYFQAYLGTGGIYGSLGYYGQYATTSTSLSSDKSARRLSLQIDANTWAGAVDGVSTSISCTTKTLSYLTTNLMLFTSSASNTSNRISAKLYSCQIYNGSNLVRDFVPCKNPSNTIGLYDLVSGTFYGNAGTGTFTAGPAV